MVGIWLEYGVDVVGIWLGDGLGHRRGYGWTLAVITRTNIETITKRPGQHVFGSNIYIYSINYVNKLNFRTHLTQRTVGRVKTARTFQRDKPQSNNRLNLHTATSFHPRPLKSVCRDKLQVANNHKGCKQRQRCKKPQRRFRQQGQRLQTTTNVENNDKG